MSLANHLAGEISNVVKVNVNLLTENNLASSNKVTAESATQWKEKAKTKH